MKQRDLSSKLDPIKLHDLSTVFHLKVCQARRIWIQVVDHPLPGSRYKRPLNPHTKTNLSCEMDPFPDAEVAGHRAGQETQQQLPLH
ncbi:hypothetical protein EYF80_054388 [Liparis tanakae]|uniref:Uncharacterized protein n=1 Tax=Liparis tanakae TaxID=230148 RepID=A0A4Z2F3V7_9TELE|nr:hypothetical protein EYF80_054388 [Liparis tanakae]